MVNLLKMDNPNPGLPFRILMMAIRITFFILVLIHFLIGTIEVIIGAIVNFGHQIDDNPEAILPPNEVPEAVEVDDSDDDDIHLVEHPYNSDAETEIEDDVNGHLDIGEDFGSVGGFDQSSRSSSSHNDRSSDSDYSP